MDGIIRRLTKQICKMHFHWKNWLFSWTGQLGWGPAGHSAFPVWYSTEWVNIWRVASLHITLRSWYTWVFVVTLFCSVFLTCWDHMSCKTRLSLHLIHVASLEAMQLYVCWILFIKGELPTSLDSRCKYQEPGHRGKSLKTSCYRVALRTFLLGLWVNRPF